MKKYYKYGEMLLALREEYKEYKPLLEDLKNCVNIKSNNSNFYFTGSLKDEDCVDDFSNERLGLFVEKKYLNLLKKIRYLEYNWYAQFLYSALFTVERKEEGLYGLKYSDILTPVDGKKYIPEIEITDQSKFSFLIDELISSGLMQLKQGYFSNNYDRVSLDFDSAYIATPLGDDSFITWSGITDKIEYSITRHNSPYLIEEILSSEMPRDKISSEWLKLLEKHENDFENGPLFHVDVNAQRKKGVLQVSKIESKRIVKLLKK